MNKRVDVAVIGSGPAGLEAAITLKMRQKEVLVFGSTQKSEKVEKAHEINNYLGFPAIKGAELAEKFFLHAKKAGISIITDSVTTVYNMGTYYSLLTKTNQMYEAKAVIVACGVSFGKPYPGEEKYLGRGVSYCATCDGALYKGKKVIVVGSSPKEEKEAAFLQEIAGEVYYVPMYSAQKADLPEKVQLVKDEPVAVEGSLFAEKLVLKAQEIAADGIFILRDTVAPAQLIPGLKMEGSHVAVNRQMETNLPGCFACGDITGAPYQYIKAAGEGNVAALTAVQYLAKMTEHQSD